MINHSIQISAKTKIVVCNLLNAGVDVIDLITDWLFLDSDLDVIIHERLHQVIMPHNLKVK